jgi:signal peptidase I
MRRPLNSRPSRPTTTRRPRTGPRVPVAKSTQKRQHNSLVELVTIVAVALGLALGIQAFLVKPFRIPSESMVPTLEIGQRVLVDRVSFRFGDPDRGDIVVFKPPAGQPSVCGVQRPSDQPCPEGTAERSDTNFIKRVVGLPGDRLKVIEGSVYINGKRQDEPFARLDRDCPTCNLPREITIPKGEYYMMGDNRGESADSREWGPVPKKWIIGKAFMTYWPPGRIGLL